MTTPAPQALIPEETVRLTYRLMLGRDVENEAVLKKHQAAGSVEALRKAIMRSGEFKAKTIHGFFGTLGAMWSAAPARVDITATESELGSLFERIRGQWKKLGEREPHHSVLTHENYKTANFSKNEEQFYESGQAMVALLKGVSKRAGYEINPAGTVLELGCGTGRVTHVLAEVFAKVIAVDVSPGHLRLCEQKLREVNKGDYECVCLESPGDVQKLPPVDIFFSTIVLQHNPPPVMHYLLAAILGKIRKGGAVFFQIPTHTAGYSFNLQEYLASAVPGMEMHCLPMWAVFALLAKNKLQPREVLLDGLTGRLGSHIFFAVRE